MAERGELQIIQKGQDLDPTCTPCRDENMRIEAFYYCSECQEYLCTRCGRQHSRRKATSDHELQTAKVSTDRKTLTSRTKCRDHPDRDIEMYCSTHDMVYCVMCIAQEHRSCADVNAIGILTNVELPQSDIDYLIDESKSASECLKADILEQQNNITTLKEQKREIQDKLNKSESEMIKHIANLKQEKAKTLDEKYSQLKGNIENDMSSSLNTIGALKDIEEKLNSVTNLDPQQKFIEIKIMKNCIKDAYTLHARSTFSGPKSIMLSSSGDTVNLPSAPFSFGEIITVENSRQASNPKRYRLESKSGDYYGMVYCDGNLWLSTSKGINVHSRDGTLINTIEKDLNHMAIFKTSTIQHMAVAAEKVIVTDFSDGAVCLCKDGKVLAELRDERLKNTDGVCVTCNGTVFLCGYSSNNIIMFSIDGTCFGELVVAECGLKNPISLCFDKNRNNLLVTCNRSNAITLIELGV
ncbi:E3 ubiquitin-protein ligase TRIM71-like [Ruditapes philippinarum]|uniref:E3 ubiquitin-protein ligase TRIM71-like n=1 Tax=Ruditapes philippinarum TaxID=129788 RepID=UPI00295AADDC|nr:E3 ubiquitin-protein ligase TRIM71-like [Ruditapes philippinarum]